MEFFKDYMIWIVIGCAILYVFVSAVNFGFTWLKDKRRVRYIKEAIPIARREFVQMSMETTKLINHELWKMANQEDEL